MEEQIKLLQKISIQLDQIINLLQQQIDEAKPFVPPDCEHL
jgi:hypothetical protein